MSPNQREQLEDCVRRGILTREQADEWVRKDEALMMEYLDVMREIADGHRQ